MILYDCAFLFQGDEPPPFFISLLAKSPQPYKETVSPSLFLFLPAFPSLMYICITSRESESGFSQCFFPVFFSLSGTSSSSTLSKKEKQCNFSLPMCLFLYYIPSNTPFLQPPFCNRKMSPCVSTLVAKIL